MIDYFSYLVSEKSKFYPFTFTRKNEHHPYCEETMFAQYTQKCLHISLPDILNIAPSLVHSRDVESTFLLTF